MFHVHSKQCHFRSHKLNARGLSVHWYLAHLLITVSAKLFCLQSSASSRWSGSNNRHYFELCGGWYGKPYQENIRARHEHDQGHSARRESAGHVAVEGPSILGGTWSMSRFMMWLDESLLNVQPLTFPYRKRKSKAAKMGLLWEHQIYVAPTMESWVWKR